MYVSYVCLIDDEKNNVIKITFIYIYIYIYKRRKERLWKKVVFKNLLM